MTGGTRQGVGSRHKQASVSPGARCLRSLIKKYVNKRGTEMELRAILSAFGSDKTKKIILDTDTFNEVDDQFALAYAMLSPDKIRLLSVNAAPFLNSRSLSAADGMEKSYREIGNIMALTDPEMAKNIPAYRGSDRFLMSKTDTVLSDARDNIIRTVMENSDPDDPVWIVAIGAITNVASAINAEPEIARRAALIWLGGHALDRPDTKEFNLKQDIFAAQAVFDSGIPMVQIACDGVCSSFITTVPELEYYLKGKNELCDYLCGITASFTKVPYAWSKVIWDVTAVGLFTVPDAYEIVQIPRPVVTSDCRYAFDAARPHYLYVRKIRRDKLYGDLFCKLSSKNNK